MSWPYDNSANRYVKTFMKEFLDLSGEMHVRKGDIRIHDGSLNIQGQSLQVADNKFVIDDLSINNSIYAAQLNIGSNIEVSGNILSEGVVGIGATDANIALNINKDATTAHLQIKPVTDDNNAVMIMEGQYTGTSARREGVTQMRFKNKSGTIGSIDGYKQLGYENRGGMIFNTYDTDESNVANATLILDSSHNVGIGTTSWNDAHKLHVQGTLNVSNGIVGILQTAAQPNITSLGTLTSLTTSGTTNLHGPTNINGNGVLTLNNTSNSNEGGELILNDGTNASGSKKWFIDSYYNSSITSALLRIRHSNWANSMVFDEANKRIGINKSNPTQMLDISGNVLIDNGLTGEGNQGGKLIFSAAYGAAGPNKIQLQSSGYGFGVDGNLFKHLAGSTTHRWYYNASTNGNGTTAMTLQNSTLGINLNSPNTSYKLDVSGTSQFRDNVDVNGITFHNDGYSASNPIYYHSLLTGSLPTGWANTGTPSYSTTTGVTINNNQTLTSPTFDLSNCLYYTDGVNNNKHTSTRILVKTMIRIDDMNNNEEVITIQLLDSTNNAVIDTIWRSDDSQAAAGNIFEPVVCDITPYIKSGRSTFTIQFNATPTGGLDYYSIKQFTICKDDSSPWYKNSVYKQQVLGGLSIGTGDYIGCDLSRQELLVQGNVGIGMTNPDYKLDVKGADAAQDLVLLNVANYATGTDTAASIGFIAAESTSHQARITCKRYASLNYGLVFSTLGYESMYIRNKNSSNSIRVGIGSDVVADPSATLEVAGNLNIGHKYSDNTAKTHSATTNYIGDFLFQNPDTATGVLRSEIQTKMALGANGNNVLTIDGANERVGIMNNAPATALDVAGNLTLRNLTGGEAKMDFIRTNGSNNKTDWQLHSNEGKFSFKANTVGGGTILQLGNKQDNTKPGALAVGGSIDMTGPTLQVIGDASINSHLTVGGDLKVNGNINFDGDVIQTNTLIKFTESIDVSNSGTQPALRVNQVGPSDNFAVAEFLHNDVIAMSIRGDSGYGGDVSMNHRLSVAGDASFGNMYIAGNLIAPNLALDTVSIDTINMAPSNASDYSIAIGKDAGLTDQSYNSIALGTNAGKTRQHDNAVAIGNEAGFDNQNTQAIAIGNAAGKNNQIQYAIAIGSGAGNNQQGQDTIAIGRSAGEKLQQQFSIALGATAGYDNQNDFAVAIGNGTGRHNQGQYGVAVGYSAGRSNQNQYSIAIGSQAADASQNEYSVAIGYQTAYRNQQKNAVAIGYQAGYNDQSGNAIAIGYQAGKTSQNVHTVALGAKAGFDNQGEFSIGIGNGGGRNNQRSYAVAVGYQAGQTNQGIFSIGIGNHAGYNYQSTNAVAIGNYAGYGNQGEYGVAIGNNAGRSNQNQYSIAIGSQAADASQNEYSVAIGYQTAYRNQHENAVAIGYQAGYKDQSGNAIAIGYQAGRMDQSANSIAMGYTAGEVNQREQSIAIGYTAGRYNQGRHSSAGYYGGAIAMGISAGTNNQRYNGIAIGRSAGYDNQSTNTIAIGSYSGQKNQKANSVALGYNAGNNNQGIFSIGIGNRAGEFNQHDNTTILNAQGSALNSTSTDSVYIKPVRQSDKPALSGVTVTNTQNSAHHLNYDISSGEVSYSRDIDISLGAINLWDSSLNIWGSNGGPAPNNSTTNTAPIYFKARSATQQWTMASIAGYYAANNGNSSNFPGGLAFNTKRADNNASTAVTTAMVIDASGQVGIGNTTPDSQLTIGSSSTSSNQYIKIATSGGNISGIKYIGGNLNEWYTQHHDGINNANRFAIGMDSNEYMSIINGGKVGIGNTNPSQQLEVSGNVLIDNGLTGQGKQGGKLIFDDAYNIAGPNKILLHSDGHGFGVDTGDALKYNSNGKHQFYVDSSSTANGNLALEIHNSKDVSMNGGASISGGAYITGDIGNMNNAKTPAGVYLGTTSTHYAMMQIVSSNTSGGIIDWTDNNNDSDYEGRIRYSTADSAGNFKAGFNFYTDKTHRMNIGATGNVGIGMTTPAYKLDVKGTSATNDLVLLNVANYATGTDTAASIGFIAAESTSHQARITCKRYDTQNYGLVFSTLGYESMYIRNKNSSNSIRVGIGSTVVADPSATLEVDGNLNIGHKYSDNSTKTHSTTTNYIGDFLFQNPDTTTGVLRSEIQSKMALGAKGTNVLTIDGVNERVGINSDSPSYTLDVSGRARILCNTINDSAGLLIENNNPASADNDAVLELHSKDIGEPTVLFSHGNDKKWAVSGGGTVYNGNYYIYDYGEGKSRLNITQAGNVGIGPNHSNPLQVLDVVGNITATGTITSSSDVNLKTNVKPLENALEKISKLQGVSYNRNDLEDKEATHIGVIAQEIEKEYPEVVSESETGKRVAYGNMIAPLIEAIKEINIKINELGNENAELKERINVLEQK
jgi:hypothetical protein